MVVPTEEQTSPEAKLYVIPRYAVDHMLESFQVERTRLSEILDIPDTNDQQWREYTEKWWGDQTVEDQHMLRRIITAMGAPALVSNVNVIKGTDGLLNTRAVFTSTRIDDPAFFIGQDADGNNYNVTYMESGSILAATLFMYLDAGQEFGTTEFKLTFSISDLITFLGVIDLYKRSSYIGLMEHTTSEFIVTSQEVYNSVDDAVTYSDIRWTLPFVILQITNDVQPPTQAEINTSINTLVQRGVLKLNEDGQTYSLTEPGLFCAKTMMHTFNKVNISSFGINESGSPAKKGAVFIRADPILWAVLVEKDSAIFTSMDLDTASETLSQLLSPPPAAVPKIEPKKVQAQPVAPICPKCGKPATWVEAYKRWYCYSCQEYLEA